jgi:hypothetical protein
MTFIPTIQDNGSRDLDLAAAIAAQLGLDLVSEGQLEQLVAIRMSVNRLRMHRLIAEYNSLANCRMIRSRHRVAKYTMEKLAKLAARDNVATQDWETVDLQHAVQHTICVRICTIAPHCAQIIKQVPSQARVASKPKPWWKASKEPLARRALSDFEFGTGLTFMAECVAAVQRLSLGAHYQRAAASEPTSSDLLRKTRGRSNLTSLLLRLLAKRVLHVEVDRERVRLAGVTTSEQAIARIEEHLHGKRDCEKLMSLTRVLPPRVI